MTKTLQTPLNINQIEDEYAPEFDIFTEEANLTYQLKRLIYNELSLTERRIILLYADAGNMREVGKRLGISTSKTHQLITDIRKKIKEKLNEHNN